MKTKLLFSMLALVVMVSAFGQRTTMELTFSAAYNAQAVPLDSILIENITQGGDTTLYAPDTILAIYITSISDCPANRENGITVSQNYPNPIKDQTTINVYLPEKEMIKIHIRDMLGREVASYDKTLSMGNHTFTFYPGNEKCYLLTVCGATEANTIKMIVASGSTSKASSCKMVYTSYNETGVEFKSQKARGNFIYLYGDTLRYTGFALTVNDVNGSDVILDAPIASEDYEFEITEGIPCPGLPTITYEDQVYNTVQIGDQCWMKEDLNVGIMIPGTQEMADNGIIEKYCYNNDTANCDEYGGLYQWNEIMQYTTLDGAQGICPDGWHIPTDEEMKILEGTVDSQYPVGDTEWDNYGWRGFDVGLFLKSVSDWNGNGNGLDLYGFAALPGGYRTSTGYFGELGISYSPWASTGDGIAAHGRVLKNNDNRQRRNEWYGILGFSCRCIKGTPIN